MTLQVWRKRTGSIIHAIIFYCILLVVEAGLDIYQYFQILNDLSRANGLGDIIKAIFGAVGPEDIIVQVLLFISCMWLFSAIRNFGQEQEDLQTAISLQKVGSALWLNFAAAIVGMIPIPVICPLASLIMEICSYVMMVSAFRYLMFSPVFNAVARSGAGTLKSYAVWSIWSIIPFIGGIFKFIAWIQFIRGWSKISNGAPVEVAPLQQNVAASMMCGETQAPSDEYVKKAEAKTDDDLKFILRHREDYNPQLIKAAETVLLNRIAGIAKPEVIPHHLLGGGVAESERVTTEFDGDKYKAYQPPVRDTVRDKEAVQQPVEMRDDSFDVVKKESKSEENNERQPVVLSQPEAEVTAVTSSSNSNLTVLLSVLGGILLVAGVMLVYFLWYVPYAKDRDASRTYVVADNVFLRSSRVAGVEYNILGKVPYGSEVITYSNLGEWAEVKVDGQEGVMASTYLLDSADFTLLSGVWGDSDSKNCIVSSKCRMAILDYYKSNYLQSGPNAWQIYTKSVNQKPNTVFYPRIYDKNSKFTDFVFIARENVTGNRVLVCYSFDCISEKPIFRFSVGAPQVGYIQNIDLKFGDARVVFDNGDYLTISL